MQTSDAYGTIAPKYGRPPDACGPYLIYQATSPDKKPDHNYLLIALDIAVIVNHSHQAAQNAHLQAPYWPKPDYLHVLPLPRRAGGR